MLFYPNDSMRSTHLRDSEITNYTYVKSVFVGSPLQTNPKRDQPKGVDYKQLKIVHPR